MKSSLFLAGTALSVAATLLAPHAARADDAYPSKPVQLVIPFPPGGVWSQQGGGDRQRGTGQEQGGFHGEVLA
ncbi:MAG: hypothetical protein EOP71_03690, partial [Variovorax sp.]